MRPGRGAEIVRAVTDGVVRRVLGGGAWRVAGDRGAVLVRSFAVVPAKVTARCTGGSRRRASTPLDAWLVIDAAPGAEDALRWRCDGVTVAAWPTQSTDP